MSFDERATADEVVHGRDLTGQEVIVTGGASGPGAETVRALASAGVDHGEQPWDMSAELTARGEI